MANTHSFDSVITQVLSESIPIQAPALPPVQLYATPIKLPGIITKGKVQVPTVGNLLATQTDPSSYEGTGDTVAGVECTMVEYSEQFGFTNPEQGQGMNLKMLLASHLTQLQTTLQTIINSIISEASFGSAVTTVSSGSYAVANLEALLAAVPARTIVALASAYFVKTKSTWMPSGEEKILKELSQLPAGNIVGFAARQESIAIPYGFSNPGPTSEVQRSMITLPIGLPVQFSRWYARGGRAWRGSLDISLSVGVGQAGAMKLIKSA